eukprot:TRINITY_DN18289_c0_g1_i1.p1 TRINITY_DN18289_c0_g1~~TRINITY_DN18289_c0_g1_i1.p1  ORF type:complete len:848 (+),score=236.78 TRINITY_DN18289_c0_g1_i1:252-2546(+)
MGGNSCPQASDVVDTYLKVPQDPTDEYLLQGVTQGSIFYDSLIASTKPSLCYQPEIGNGYIATVPNWDAVYIPGLYNGKCGNIHKARIPSPLRVAVNGTEVANYLDTNKAVFVKHWTVQGVTVEQMFYAHRAYRHVLVMSLKSSGDVGVDLVNSFDISGSDMTGSGCAGSFTNDFKWGPPVVTATNTTYAGTTTDPNDDGVTFTVQLTFDNIPSTLHMVGGQVYDYVFMFSTTVEGDTLTPPPPPRGDLFATHLQEWSKLLDTGIDIWPSAVPTNATVALDGLGLNFNTGEAIARHVNASIYFLRSSIRADWTHGVSPGGIATQNYQGAIFFDMDWYIAPPLRLLHPELARGILQYRYLSLNESKKIATLFGYKGAMFAWTAAHKGSPFGCCDGKGGYEDCLEQHITGDVAVGAWAYYLASGDVDWLREVGYPILQLVAEWVASRVTPRTANGTTVYDIADVLPVDEWCVGSGCGCETPGVANDAQMNAVCKLAMEHFLSAVQVLNETVPPQLLQQYTDIAEHIVILKNTTHNRHTQFTSPTCPGGFGGTHYTPSHTVCPEDVLYLSYPLGEALGVPAEVTQSDYEFFVPVTCEENSGMTTPIHTVVQLDLLGQQLGNVSLMEAEFNRSMYAGCYGPYYVRNEVDKHPDITGGHFDNTHFLTGDGGYLQSLVYGFSGLRVTEAGLRWTVPRLPSGVASFRLRNITWHGVEVTIRYEEGRTEMWRGPSGVLCLTDASGSVHPITPQGTQVQTSAFHFPGLFTTTC